MPWASAFTIRRIKSIGRVALPDAMRSWSEALPPEQWAKPSEELLRVSQAVQTLREQRPELNLATRFTQAQQLHKNLKVR